MEGEARQSKVSLPGSGTVLTYGILAIFLSVPLVFCCPLGLLFAIMGITKGGRAKKTYLQDPDKYVDYNQLTIGIVLSYIGLALSIIVLFLFLLFFGPMLAWIFAFLGMNP